MEWRNPFFSSAGAIDCEINHHSLGWIPTTIPSDHAMFAELAAVAAPWVPPPAPTPEEILHEQMRALEGAVQAHIAATARARGYDNGMALAGYVNSTVPPWKAEAEAFIAWRDAVWLFVFEKLAQVQAGKAAPPESPEALIAALPQIDWNWSAAP